MIRVPILLRSMLLSHPLYRFGGSHGQLDRMNIFKRDNKSGYFLNPNETARRMIRLIAQHEKVEDPQNLTLNTQWHEIGLNELDLVQLFIGIENEFDIEFPDEITQKFKDIHDTVQYVSRSFWAE